MNGQKCHHEIRLIEPTNTLLFRRIQSNSNREISRFGLPLPKYYPKDRTFYQKDSKNEPLHTQNEFLESGHASRLFEYAHDFLQRLSDHTQTPLEWEPTAANPKIEQMLEKRDFKPAGKAPSGNFEYRKQLQPRKGNTPKFTKAERKILEYVLEKSGWKKSNGKPENRHKDH